MRRSFRLCLIWAVLAAGLTPQAGQCQPKEDGSLERVRQAGKLVVAIDPTYPPMVFPGEDGNAAGFDVDVARAVAERLGVKAEFQPMPWDGIISGLDAKRYDVIISAMNVTPERQKQVDFVEYARMSQVYVCRPGTVVADEKDLAGKSVSVQTNTTSHEYAEGLKRQGVGLTDVLRFPNAWDAFAALDAGHAQVVVTDEPVGKYYAKKYPRFVVTGQAMAAEPIGIAVRKADRSLHRAVGEAVGGMRADGTLTELSKEWFGGELGSGVEEPLGFWDFSTRVVLPRLLPGLGYTVLLTALAGVAGIALGLVLALARISPNPLLNRPALAYVTLFRGTPLLLQLLFIFSALPILFQLRLNPFSAGVVALSLNVAAYVCEILRAAIESIDRGQMEAARALGMSYGLAMRRVILPQTYRRALPPLVNELAALSKDTSLVMVISLPELLFETNRVTAMSLRPWEVYVWAAAGYLLIVLCLSSAAGYLERHLATRGG